jgi:glutamate dehydrogenase/leucine dehydrogenase
MKGKTMALQGFGNVGRYAAILAPEILGTKLIAVGDEYGQFTMRRG